MLTSAPGSIGMLTSASCKRITCAEVNDLCRNKLVPKLIKFFEICAEVLVPKFSELSSPVPKFDYPLFGRDFVYFGSGWAKV